eukprot:TRINITY_DN616_c0_g1_i2.p1 TRINITY_DN616_c0_g1~~TRINITY_DN616_c0_g1_i2.p1  ORF type:complete len:284 (-),score=65.71 TRINITY_DN616_c0_g1_i2:195-1046(-)
MSLSKPVILAVGPTGGGKSTLISRYASKDQPQPEKGHTLHSQTHQTKSFECDVGGKQVKFYDTPGLGDSEERDQVFLDELVQTLQSNCNGIHKFYFMMAVTEPRFNTYLSICLSLLLQLAPDLKEKPGILNILLSKADKGDPKLESYWGADKIDVKIQQLKDIVKMKFQIDVNVIVAGDNNQEQFIESVKSTSLDVFTQTQFMKNVQTLDTKAKEAYEKLEEAKKDKEQDQQKIAMLQEGFDKASEDAKQSKELFTKEIDELKNQIANMPRNEGGGGGGCHIL